MGRDFLEAIFDILVDPFHILIAHDVNPIQASAEKAAHDFSAREGFVWYSRLETGRFEIANTLRSFGKGFLITNFDARQADLMHPSVRTTGTLHH